MGRRYSDIKRAAKLQQALTGYINHLQTAGSRPSKIGTKGARDLSQTVYIEPFTVGIEVDEVVQARCNPTAFTNLSAAINASTIAKVSATLGSKAVVSFPKFSPARVVLFRNATRNVEVKPSEVTGLQYLKYTGNRFSCPFGATAAIDDQMDAFLDVKARLLAANAAAATKRVSLIREKVGVESI